MKRKICLIEVIAVTAFLIAGCGKSNSSAIADIDSSDDSVNEAIAENIELENDRKIESYGWVDSSKECFHVSVERTEEEENEYSHVQDYFFIKKDGIICLNVEYPSKQDDQSTDRYVYDCCDFSAEYVDVTFDGQKDLVISLGHQGAPGTEVSCAYIYEDNAFVYTKSFEEIPNYSINEDEQCIVGEFDGNITSYIYQNGTFTEK